MCFVSVSAQGHYLLPVNIIRHISALCSQQLQWNRSRVEGWESTHVYVSYPIASSYLFDNVYHYILPHSYICNHSLRHYMLLHFDKETSHIHHVLQTVISYW